MPLANLHHYLNHALIFVLTYFGWFCSIMLNPYFWWQYHFVFTLFFHLHQLIQKHNYWHKNGLGVVHFPWCHILPKKSICHGLWSDTYIRNLSFRTANSTYVENFILKRTKCLHKILIRTGKMVWKFFKMLKIAFKEQIVGRTQVWSGSPNSENVWTLLKIPNTRRAHQQGKQMKLLTECRTCLRKQKNPRSCTQVGNFIWVTSKHF